MATARMEVGGKDRGSLNSYIHSFDTQTEATCFPGRLKPDR